MTERAGAPAVPGGAVRLGGVLEHRQPVPRGDRADRGHVGRVPVEVNGQDEPACAA